MELRNNVKQILQEKKKYNKKFTQKWLYTELDISKQYMSNICNNKDQPTLLLALRICKALDVEVEKVFNIIELK